MAWPGPNVASTSRWRLSWCSRAASSNAPKSSGSTRTPRATHTVSEPSSPYQLESFNKKPSGMPSVRSRVSGRAGEAGAKSEARKLPMAFEGFASGSRGVGGNGRVVLDDEGEPVQVARLGQEVGQGRAFAHAVDPAPK